MGTETGLDWLAAALSVPSDDDHVGIVEGMLGDVGMHFPTMNAAVVPLFVLPRQLTAVNGHRQNAGTRRVPIAFC